MIRLKTCQIPLVSLNSYGDKELLVQEAHIDAGTIENLLRSQHSAR